jgi:hypothetical protein
LAVKGPAELSGTLNNVNTKNVQRQGLILKTPNPGNPIYIIEIKEDNQAILKALILEEQMDSRVSFYEDWKDR